MSVVRDTALAEIILARMPVQYRSANRTVSPACSGFIAYYDGKQDVVH